jgi:acetyl-CoA carboxylase carboxyl transferase subunit alpha
MEAWQSVQFSRHPARPTSRDHVDEICDYFFELRGDGCGKDDKAVITGVATISRFRIALAAIDKGKGISERKLCRFGMPNPEGFRKTRRLFALAEKLSLPLLCLVDTPGAFPGHEAEEAGQAHAISKNLARLFSLATPIITVFIGEGEAEGLLPWGWATRS